MPLFQEINNEEESWGGIWKITETLEEVCDMLPRSAYYREQAFRFVTEKRRIEYATVRLLIFTLTGEEPQVEYLPSGRPFFRDGGLRLSISHTHGYAAVLLSEKHDVGIDIEAFSERIMRLKERITDSEEEARTAYELLLHWSAKESVFKILDEEGIDFKKNLTVRGLICDARPGHAETKGNFSVYYHLPDGKTGVLPIRYETTADFVLTYALRKSRENSTLPFVQV